MKPREHGAYAMLTFPVVSGWIVGGLSLAGVGFAVAVLGGFLAHEPATVLLGGRGERLATSAWEEAWRRLLSRLAAALAGVSVFVYLAPAEALQAAAWPLAGALGVGALLVAGRVKSVPGEIWVAATFASVHLPIAAAGGASGAGLWLPALVWLGGFVPPTLAVHALKARFKAARSGKGTVRNRWTASAAPAAAVLVTAAAVGAAAAWGLTGSLAVLPMAVAAGVVSVLAIHPRHLKRVGWTMVLTDVATLILLAILVA